MINKIYTYKNPMDLRNMSIWEDIRSYPHLCVSQTLVEGMKEYYGRETFTLICTVDNFLKKAFSKWHNSEMNDLKQNIEIMNILDLWDKKDGKNKDLLRTFRHNRKDVIKSIRYLIESEIDYNKILQTNSLNEEQELLFEILNKIKDKAVFKIDDTCNNIDSIDECYIEILEDEMRKYINPEKRKESKKDSAKLVELFKNEIGSLSKRLKELNSEGKSENKEIIKRQFSKFRGILNSYEKINQSKDMGLGETQKVVIHGVHQITPLILKMLEVFKKNKIEVIVLFNYIKEFESVFQTWKNVYSWANVEFIHEGKDFEDGRKFGKNIGLAYEGNLSGVIGDYKEKYYKFDNLTGFTNYVSGVYEKADRKYKDIKGMLKKNHDDKLIKIALMSEQFYAVNGEEINKQLKIYFPEQFSDRHFLTYPIGQFILSLYELWDDKSNKIKIIEESMKKALTLDIWSKDGKPSPVDMFNNLKMYFSNCTKFDEYNDRLEKLIKSTANEKKNATKDNMRKRRMAFFIYTVDELQYFKSVINKIKQLADKLFSEERDNLKNNFKKLMEHIEILMIEPLEENKVTQTELSMVEDISEKLEGLQDEDNETYIRNIKEAIFLYLSSSASDEYKAEWIVRDFEQIDGGVLLAAAQERDKLFEKNSGTYHFAGVSEENMLMISKKSLPWPLSNELYLEFDNDIAGICENARKQYDRFIRYSLFYGTYFLSKNKNVTLSYIESLGDDRFNPYTIIHHLMNVKAEYLRVRENLHDCDFNQLYEDISEIKVSSNISESEERSMSTCFYRYLWNHCLDKDTYFFDNWQLNIITKYFCQYTYVAKKELFNMESFRIYKGFLPFLSETDYAEIELKIKEKNGEKDSNRYIDNKMEFIYRDFTSEKINKVLLIEDFQNKLYGGTEINFNTIGCNNCNQKNLCEFFIDSLKKEEI